MRKKAYLLGYVFLASMLLFFLFFSIYLYKLPLNNFITGNVIDAVQVNVTVANVTVGDTVTFTGNASTNSTIILYEWDFEGDGDTDWTSRTTPNTTYKYRMIGNYTAILRVTDESRDVKESQINISVTARYGRIVRAEMVYEGLVNTQNTAEFNMPIRTSNDDSMVVLGYIVPDSGYSGAYGDPCSGYIVKSAYKPGGTWNSVLVDDNMMCDPFHDQMTLGFDADNYLHVFPGIHNAHLKYYRSTIPRSINVQNSSANFSTYEATYPRLWDRNGILYFTYRDRGVNAGGTGHISIYHPSNQSWSDVEVFSDQTIVSGMEYPWTTGKVPLAIDSFGRIYSLAAWSNVVLGTQSGWNITFAFSDDNGSTWNRTDGSVYALPINITGGNPDIILTEDAASDIGMPFPMWVDSSRRIHFFFNSGSGTYDGEYHMYLSNSTWSTPQAFSPDFWDIIVDSNDTILIPSYQYLTFGNWNGSAYSLTQYDMHRDFGIGSNIGYYKWPDYSAWTRFSKVRFMFLDSTSVWFVEAKSYKNTAPAVLDGFFTTYENTSRRIRLYAYDPDEDNLKYTIITQPSHGVLTGTPPYYNYTPESDFIGIDNFTFNVNDSVRFSYNATVLINVTEKIDAPVIDSIGNQTIDENENIAFTVYASHPFGDLLTYSAEDIPPGASFNTSTHFFNWTPNSTQVSFFPVTFSVEDEDGHSDNETVTIEVQGLILLLRFDNTSLDSSTITHDDSCCSSNNGSVHGGANYTANGRYYGAYDFYGHREYIQVNRSQSLLVDGALTVSLWLNASSAQPTNGAMPIAFYEDDTDKGWYVGPEWGEPYSYFPVVILSGSSSNSRTIGSFYSNFNNRWTHLAFVFKPSEYLKIYVNGTLVNQTSSSIISQIYYDTFEDLGIGLRLSSPSTYSYNGTIDEVAIWSRALNSSEILDVYEHGAANYPPVLSSIGNKSVNESTHLSFFINATDLNLDSLNFSTSTLPSGSLFNSSTQIFNWTPNSSQLGTYSIVFTVSDNVGGLDYENVTVRVVGVGCVDSDNDGYLEYNLTSCPSGNDCNDSNDTVYPTAFEVCEGVDTDCDGTVDEDCNCLNQNTSSCGSSVGSCTLGIKTCVDGSWDDCVGSVPPTKEWCDDGVDSNCDGVDGLSEVNCSSDVIRYHFDWNASVGENSTKVYDWSGHGKNATIATAGAYTAASGTNSTLIQFSQANVLVWTNGTLNNWKIRARDSVVDVINFTSYNATNRTFELSSPISGLTSGDSFEIFYQNLTSFRSGYHGGAFYLDGADDHMDIPSVNYPYGFAFALWMNLSEVSGEIMCQGWGNVELWPASPYMLTLFMRNGTGGSVWFSSAQNFSLNNYTFVAVLFNGSQTYLFINNETTLDSTLLNKVSISSAEFGKYSRNGDTPTLNGTIDEFRLWNITLNVSQMRALYNSMITNNKPILSIIGDKYISEGENLLFYVNGTEYDGDSITYSIIDAPDGSLFSSQIFNWTPNSTQSGSYDVLFYVNDSTGLYDMENVTITVSSSDDADADGYDSIDSSGTDCNDNNANIHPGATDTCENSVDEDCDGSDSACSSGDSPGGGGGGMMAAPKTATTSTIEVTISITTITTITSSTINKEKEENEKTELSEELTSKSKDPSQVELSAKELIEEKPLEISSFKLTYFWWFFIVFFLLVLSSVIFFSVRNHQQKSQVVISTIPESLLSYINEATTAGMGLDEIKNALIGAGWPIELIDEALNKSK